MMSYLEEYRRIYDYSVKQSRMAPESALGSTRNRSGRGDSNAAVPELAFEQRTLAGER